MKMNVSKQSQVIEIKEDATGVLLSFASDQDLNNVTIQAFLVDESYTKREFIPTMSIETFKLVLGCVVPHIVREFDSAKHVILPFSKGGALPLSDGTYVELHINNADDKAYDVLTYQNLGLIQPIYIKQTKLSSEVSNKDIDVSVVDYFVAKELPNELQAIVNGQRVRFDRKLLNFDRHNRFEGLSYYPMLMLSGIDTLTLYKETGSEYEFYLVDVF